MLPEFIPSNKNSLLVIQSGDRNFEPDWHKSLSVCISGTIDLSLAIHKILNEERQVDRLHGRTALVTGAARGLGAQIVRRFAEEGAHVIVNDLNLTAAQETAKKYNGDAFACDVSAMVLTETDDLRYH